MSNVKHEQARQEPVFKALADYRRREMLDLLRDKPQTTGDICRHFNDLDRCTVMQHLGVLEKAGLVIAKRQGRQRWNYINPIPIKEIYDRWISRYATHAIDILARMKHDLDGS
jgi:DNA-binding transcriptional ArsR family regulator